MYQKLLFSTSLMKCSVSNAEHRFFHTFLSKKFWNKNAKKNILSRTSQRIDNKNSLQINLAHKRFQGTDNQPSPPPKRKSLILLSWKSVAVSFIFGSALLLMMNKMKREKLESQKRQRKQQIGKMAIGGPFELIDQDGKLVKNTDFLGKWMLIYFGFTHCPDICPEEMDKMGEAVDLVEKVDLKGAKLVPLFITVDPDRDDVKAINKYLKDFSPKLKGLTGDKKQIEQVTKAYRVYFSSGPKDEDNDYIVDHTVIMYLVDPEGNFVDYFGQNKKASEVATAIAIHMGTYERGANEKKSSE